MNNNVVPEEVKGWNWGAFMYSVFWGFGNKTYLPLLTLVPVFGLIWVFVVGVKGNEWAWKNGNYTDVATFRAVQETWNRGGLVMFILVLLSLFAVVGMVVFFGGLAVLSGNN